jgi:undecaprenyl diphosphate synthase
MTVILAIAYSGQDEIIRAFRQYIALGNDASVLDEKKLLEFLDSGAFPPPDLIVRT